MNYKPDSIEPVNEVAFSFLWKLIFIVTSAFKPESEFMVLRIL